MKKLLYLIVFIGFTACDEETVTEPKNFMALVLEDMKVNQEVLDEAFANVATLATYDVLKNEFKTSKSKKEFIVAMNEKVEGALLKAAENTEPNISAYLQFAEKDRETTERVLNILTEKSPLESYFKLIEESTKDEDHKGWIMIQSLSSSTTQADPLPTEDFSLNYEEIKTAINLKDILLSTQSGDEREKAVEEYIALNNMSPIIIGMLLPAVQAAREDQADPLEKWLNAAVKQGMGGSTKIDILGKVEAAGYAGALDLLVAEGYDNTNQYSASADLLYARFIATLMFVWNDVWESYN